MTTATAVAVDYSNYRVNASNFAKEQEEVIEAAMNYPFAHVVERYSKEHDVPKEVALEHARELKRYLALSALFPEKMYGMVGTVDKLWHTFIMFTQDYMDFCNKVNKRYIHHDPESLDADETESNKTFESYHCFLEDYKVVFGEEPPVHIWPRPINYEEMASQPQCIVRPPSF